MVGSSSSSSFSLASRNDIASESVSGAGIVSELKNVRRKQYVMKSHSTVEEHKLLILLSRSSYGYDVRPGTGVQEGD